MGDRVRIFATQLREASRCTGVSWVAWLRRTGDRWEIITPQRLSKVWRSSLSKFIQAPQASSWLAGALTSGHTRSRSAGSYSKGLGCAQIYAFPNPSEQDIILVGDGHLDKDRREFFRVLALGSPGNVAETDLDETLPTLERFIDNGLDIPYDPDKFLERILTNLVQAMQCEWAYLAIRSGDYWRIQAVMGYPAEFLGQDLVLTSTSMLASMVEKRQAMILDKGELESCTKFDGVEHEGSLLKGLIAPIILGKRVIGMVLLASERMNAFNPYSGERVMKIVTHLAPSIENAIIFAEAVRYLEQFALLNDLALATSGGQNPDEVSIKVVHRLRRSFNTDQVAVLLLSPDGKSLTGYGNVQDDDLPPSIPVAESLGGYVLEKSQSVRVGDIRLAPRFFPWKDQVCSALFAPIRFQGEPIGVIGLQSERCNAFTLQDEQLLNVIASHLAGLIENARLNQEARERANKLTLIHKVVQRVVGLRDETAIAREVADLIAGYFNYEIASVLVSDETNQFLSVLGVGGSLAHLIPPAYHYPISQGITGKAFRTGRGGIFNDVSLVSEYLALPGWRASSEMCVPMFERERVFGLINVESARKNAFSESDYIMLEALAGIISSVMVNARRYRELKQRIEAQESAENRLVRSARLAAVGEMAAGIAHELNNPLTTVLGFLELTLADLPAASQQRSDLELAAREAQRAREVVRRLLDFSRQSGNVRERIELNALMQEVYSLVHHQLQTSNVSIQMDLSPRLPAIAANGNQIKQVILNLFQNALQAMPDGGEIRVRTGREMRAEGLGAFIKICDTGEGIPPENYERIFEPFFTTRSTGQGTGLGLSVSYGIITSHGGHIEVDSVLGRGSCFNVWLPVDAEK